MKKLKQTVLVLASAGMLSTQAHAAESSVNSLPSQQSLAAFSKQDVQGLFDQAEQPMQLAALSRTEMKETEGAWVHWAVGGALIRASGGGIAGNIAWRPNIIAANYSFSRYSNHRRW